MSILRGFISTNLSKVAQARWRAVRRAFEEVVLRRPLASEFRCYLSKNFGPATVNDVQQALTVARSLGRQKITAGQLFAIPSLNDATARLRERAQRMGRPSPVDASIIVPVHDNVAHTLMCLLSVVMHESRYRFEVIVGDDASSDATESLLTPLRGPIVYLRHAENKGYLENCNASVARARGRYVVLINNDTLVLPGWLDELIDFMEASADTGLVGSKLLFGSGRLQEAGGIVWKDASTSNFGRDDDPDLPQFNYVKDVDCCAAASIAVRADLWRKLEGFDARYAPAYFEDTDLAFRIRAAGLRTVYRPSSVVVHHEAATHGRDETRGARKHLVKNREIFYQRWREVLAREHFERATDLFLARDRSGGRPHVLVIDRDLPALEGDEDARAIFDLISACSQDGMQLSLWPEKSNPSRRDARNLQSRGIEVLDGPHYGRNLQRWIAENGRYLDYILLGRPGAGPRSIDWVGALTRARVLDYRTDIIELRQAARRRLAKKRGL